MWVSPDEGGWGETGQAKVHRRLFAQRGGKQFTIWGNCWGRRQKKMAACFYHLLRLLIMCPYVSYIDNKKERWSIWYSHFNSWNERDLSARHKQNSAA
jgi:hypothetical protein